MRLISRVLIFYVMMEGCYTQFDFDQFFNQQPLQQPDFVYQNVRPNNYYGSNQQMPPYFMNNFNYQGGCDCSCDKCHNFNPCCSEFCQKCAPASNPAYIFYPYPYIVVAPPNSKAPPTPEILRSPTTTEATTTQVTTPETTTTEVPTTQATTTTIEETTLSSEMYPEESERQIVRTSKYLLRENLLKELIYNPSKSNHDNDNIIMTAMRRTNPRWMPKYGIVPIPDQLVEKLMLRMRHVKVLHPEVDTIRRTDPIYP